MTPTHEELTAAIQTARDIQDMPRNGDLPKGSILSFNDAERFIVLCERILEAMPAPEPAPSLAETVYKTIIEPHAQKHISVFSRDNMPAQSERPAPKLLSEGDPKKQKACGCPETMLCSCKEAADA